MNLLRSNTSVLARRRFTPSLGSHPGAKASLKALKKGLQGIVAAGLPVLNPVLKRFIAE